MISELVVNPRFIRPFPNVPLQEAIAKVRGGPVSIMQGFTKVELNSPERHIPETPVFYDFTMADGRFASTPAVETEK